MDAFLIIITIVLAIILFVVSFYLLAYYCHTDESKFGSSLFCKILVVLGLTLSWAQVLILPLDVANAQGEFDGLNVETLWYIVYLCIIVMVSILIPFAMFLYEDDEEKTFFSRLTTAICYTFVYFAVAAAIFFITFAYWREAKIPLKIQSQTISSVSDLEDSTTSSDGGSSNDENIDIKYNCNFFVYCMAFLGFIGWILFAVFGGVGLSALPIDMIRDFAYRPKIRSTREAKEIKDSLKGETTRLIELGSQIAEEEKIANHQDGFFQKRSAKSKVKKLMKQFQVGTFYLERNYQIFKLELNYLDHNPLIYIGKLILGILFAITSLLWWLHIILFVLIDPPASNFLNELLTFFSSKVGFIATAIFAYFTLYLLWCTTKGTLKMGLRILFFTIHPMKKDETWMNSFLFNVQLILISSVAVTQFCSSAFSQYARLTEISLIFNGIVRYLRFFVFFNDNHIFEYILVIWSAICALYLTLTAPKRDGVLQDIDELKKQKYKA